MTPDETAKLRERFAPEVVGKLPKVTCRDCSNPKARCPKADGEHKPRRCQTCQAWLTPAHMHVDFVGHALVTDRLLSVDPNWTWEPMGLTPEGTPAIGTSANGRDAVMWVRLTVCGVTRAEVGMVPLGSHELEKQLVSDAITRAAMRFGVALNLWAKGELEPAHQDPDGAPRSGGRRSGQAAQGGSPPPPAPPPTADDGHPRRVPAAWVREMSAKADAARVTQAVRREIATKVSDGRTGSLSALNETEVEAAERALATVIAETEPQTQGARDATS